jgi:hypothetical protein
MLKVNDESNNNNNSTGAVEGEGAFAHVWLRQVNPLEEIRANATRA